MSAAPVEDAQKPMSNRGTAQEANEHLEKAPAQSSKGDAATQVADSKDAGSGTTGRGNQAGDEVPGDDPEDDGKGKGKKKGEDDVPAEKKVDMSKYAIHSDLKDELDEKISHMDKKDIGVTNPEKQQEQAERAEAEEADGEDSESRIVSILTEARR